MRDEHALLVDCLERLNRAGLPYMLTGSMATNFWGTVRTTHDLDFVLALKPTEAEIIIGAFGDGFFLQPESVRQVFQPPYQFNAIDEQSALKVDFWLLRDNLFEKHMFDRRVQVRIVDMPAWVATPEDLILHKLYWHSITPSDRQLGDAAGVFTVQGNALDVNTCDNGPEP